MHISKDKLISIFFFLVFFSYVFTIFALLSGNSEFANSIEYIFILFFYAYIAIFLWWDAAVAHESHLDRSTLILISIFGFFRSRINTPNEKFYQSVIFLFALIILLACYKNWQKIPKTNWRWVGISILSWLVVIPISLMESLQPEAYYNIQISSMGLGVDLIGGVLYNLSFVAPMEEVIFRGLLWGYLQRIGWKENRAFWGQALMFWLMHFWKIGNPVTFFFTIPIGTLAYSLLTRYSKQVIPSITLHTFLNLVFRQK